LCRNGALLRHILQQLVRSAAVVGWNPVTSASRRKQAVFLLSEERTAAETMDRSYWRSRLDTCKVCNFVWGSLCFRPWKKCIPPRLKDDAVPAQFCRCKFQTQTFFPADAPVALVKRPLYSLDNLPGSSSTAVTTVPSILKRKHVPEDLENSPQPLGWVEFPLISQIENIGCGKAATSNEKQNPKRNFEIGLYLQFAQEGQNLINYNHRLF